MEATHTVALYAVAVALLCLALGSLVIYSRRELRMRLIALVLSVAMMPIVWFAFSEFPGTPEAITAEQFREQYRCARIIPVDKGIRERVGILLLAQKEETDVPEYLFVSWNMRLATSLQKSMRVAKLNGKGSIIYGGQSCMSEDEGGGKGKKGKGKKGKPPKLPGSSGQEQDGPDDFNFYADPVTPNPEKNYGPLYEGPLAVPDRK